ncbi:MAG: response regulator [Bacteroidota bacterium]
MIQENVRILIIEDEGIVAMELQESLEKEGFDVVGIADNGVDAIEMFKNDTIDLVLIDIHIKGQWDGIETATELKKHKDVPFIYITANSDSPTFERAKNTRPAAFLNKPFRINDLRKAIELAMYNFSQKQSATETKDKDSLKKEASDQDRILHFNNAIFVKQNYKYIKLSYCDIMYLKVDGNYTYIQTIEKKHVIKNSLQNLIDIFGAEFIRVHRSFAINIQHLTGFNESTLHLGQEEIPLGRNYKDAFMLLFKQL